MNKEVLSLYNPEFPLDWVNPDLKIQTSYGNVLQEHSEIKKIFGAEQLMVTFPYYKPTQNVDCHLLYGKYSKGWYRLLCFFIGRFPGCCGIQLVHDLSLMGLSYYLLDNKVEPLLEEMVKFYEVMAKTNGYTLIMATEIEADPCFAAKELKAYSNSGWKPLKDFVNSRTTNKVTVLCKEL